MTESRLSPEPARTNKQFILAVLAGFVFTACSGRGDDSASRTPADSTAAVPGEWVVRPDGIGVIRSGMTLAELSTALGEEVRAGYQDFEECDYVQPGKLPAGVALMVLADTVMRVDVDSIGVATAEGARVGDTEARILELYRGRVQVEPHKYAGPEGHYLVVSPPGDTLHRIIFETDSGKVTTFRSGRRPAVEYVEGCA